MISLIAAVAENGVIGADNKLLWHIPEDLKRFKVLTTNKVVIMGRKTYQSLPFQPLPKRRNIIISRNEKITFKGAEIVNSIEGALELLNPAEEHFVIGGGAIYHSFLPLADKIYLTKVHELYEGDTYFPNFDTNKWDLIESSNQRQEKPENLMFTYLTYIRKL